MFGTLPTLVGISLATFVILNLSLPPSSDPRNLSVADPALIYSAHLPLFLNLYVEDARTASAAALSRLSSDSDAEAQLAIGDIRDMGGAWLPHLLPALATLEEPTKHRLLQALEPVASRIAQGIGLASAADKVAFWTRYQATYGSDYQQVRVARLVQRLVRRVDSLATEELRRLDTYALPQLFEALSEDIDGEAQDRLAALIGTLLGKDMRLSPRQSAAQRLDELSRWDHWWQVRRERYRTLSTVERGFSTLTQTRYFCWLTHLATLDFGMSERDGISIRSKLASRLPVTLALSGLALLLAYGLAVPLGIVAAVRRGSAFDRLSLAGSLVLYAIPAFWTAILLLYLFSDSGLLPMAPTYGTSTPGSEALGSAARLKDFAHHLFLPVLCLAVVPMAALARYQRAGMLQVIDRDFMRTARAKGLSPTQAILRHGLRNSLIPVVTLLGVEIPYLVSGSVVVERIFGIAGMGLETFEAVRAFDRPWLIAVVSVTALLTLLGDVIADLLYAQVDPRIAPGGRSGQ
jgi:peptide/nickel transport system permease protein